MAVERTAWRVCADHRDPCACSRPRGRWDDGSFDVLYTSETADGAIAEMYFHLRRGQPVLPTKLRFKLHKLNVRFERLLDLSDRSVLAELGLDMGRYGRLNYGRHQTLYPSSQNIAEVAHFLEFDGLQVPNARWNCENLIVFCDQTRACHRAPDGEARVVSWDDWQIRAKGISGG